MTSRNAVSTTPISLDASWLQAVGLADLPAELANELLASTYEHLEVRVGMALAATMTDDELDEFEHFIDTDDEAGALAWLEEHFPHYPAVVREHLDAVTAEVRSHAASILNVVADLEAAPCD